MSEQQTKRRFFIAGDVVKHKKTGVVYTVDSHQDYEDAVDIFYEPSNVECLHKELWTQALVPFDELEMVEPYGVYMSNSTPVKTGQDLAKEWGLDKTDAPKAPMRFARINKTRWKIFNDPSIDMLVYFHDDYWVVSFTKNTPAEKIEPQFARAFLDSIGLTEDLEPRIGNQEAWDRLY